MESRSPFENYLEMQEVQINSKSLWYLSIPLNIPLTSSYEILIYWRFSVHTFILYVPAFEFQKFYFQC